MWINIRKVYSIENALNVNECEHNWVREGGGGIGDGYDGFFFFAILWHRRCTECCLRIVARSTRWVSRYARCTQQIYRTDVAKVVACAHAALPYLVASYLLAFLSFPIHFGWHRKSQSEKSHEVLAVNCSAATLRKNSSSSNYSNNKKAKFTRKHTHTYITYCASHQTVTWSEEELCVLFALDAYTHTLESVCTARARHSTHRSFVRYSARSLVVCA